MVKEGQVNAQTTRVFYTLWHALHLSLQVPLHNLTGWVSLSQTIRDSEKHPLRLVLLYQIEHEIYCLPVPPKATKDKGINPRGK